MNIVILSHERSLNKSEGLLSAYKDDNVILITDNKPNESKKYVINLALVIDESNSDNEASRYICDCK